MNIFILDYDIEKCAQYHCDKHVVKMILEYAQLLCTTHHIAISRLEIPYRKTHQNHPVAIWARNSLTNYIWLVNLGLELCKEYTYRYGKIHKTQKVIEWCSDNLPNIKDFGLTPFAQAMPEEYKNQNAVIAYRNYYNGEKKNLFSWKNREVPKWIKNTKKNMAVL